jgi:hypothetical protein
MFKKAIIETDFAYRDICTLYTSIGVLNKNLRNKTIAAEKVSRLLSDQTRFGSPLMNISLLLTLKNGPLCDGDSD